MRNGHRGWGFSLIISILAVSASLLLPNSRVAGAALENTLKPVTNIKSAFAKLKIATLTSVNRAGKSVDVEAIKKKLGGPGPVNIVLDATLEPKSDDVIDCRGGSIMPRKLAAANRGVSIPDTLIHLGKGVERVTIKNCRLDATFPIVITGGKAHRISFNNIQSSGNSIYVLDSEGVIIDHNWMRSMGINIEIRAGSQDTLVYNNHLDYQAGGFKAGGWPGITGNEPREGGRGVYMFSVPGVIYLVINDRLIQVLSYRDTRPTGTIIRENTIDLRPAPIGGIGIGFATRSSRSLAQGNIILGGEEGLSILGVGDEWIFFEPGVCSGDPGLACNPEDGLCEFLGIGSCVDWKEVKGGGHVLSPTMIENRVSGARNGLIGGFSEDFVFENNHLENNGVGILLPWFAMGSSTRVRGNIASHNEFGLIFEDDNFNPVECPGLDLSYNDFGDNDQPFDAHALLFSPDFEIIDVLPYEKPTSLPNNWWGSDPCGFPENPEQWPNVVGPSSAALPIAAAWAAGEADSVPRCDLDVEPVQCEEE
jgi:hypothetical protein